MTAFYNHWHEMPEGIWRWKNFSPAEIACRGTGKLLVNGAALDRLQALRDRLGKPFIVRSAYRSPEHNRATAGPGDGRRHHRGPHRQQHGARPARYPSGVQGNVVNELVIPNYKNTWADIRKLADKPAAVSHLSFKAKEYNPS